MAGDAEAAGGRDAARPDAGRGAAHPGAAPYGTAGAADGVSADAAIPTLNGDAAVEAVAAALHDGRLRVAITGAVGVGKSTLLRALRSRLEGAFACVYLPVPHFVPAEIRAWIAAHDGPLPIHGGSALEDLAAAYERRHGGLVLLVDDAQGMPADVARALAAAQARAGSALRLVVAGLDDLRFDAVLECFPRPFESMLLDGPPTGRETPADGSSPDADGARPDAEEERANGAAVLALTPAPARRFPGLHVVRSEDVDLQADPPRAGSRPPQDERIPSREPSTASGPVSRERQPSGTASARDAALAVGLSTASVPSDRLDERGGPRRVRDARAVALAAVAALAIGLLIGRWSGRAPALDPAPVGIGSPATHMAATPEPRAAIAASDVRRSAPAPVPVPPPEPPERAEPRPEEPSSARQRTVPEPAPLPPVGSGPPELPARSEAVAAPAGTPATHGAALVPERPDAALPDEPRVVASISPPAAAADAPSIPVHVNARPWARIAVDGRDLGLTPLGNVPLQEGTHRFRAELADGRVIEREVRIDADHRQVTFP